MKPRFQRDLRRHFMGGELEDADARDQRAPTSRSTKASSFCAANATRCSTSSALDRIEYAVRVYGVDVVAIDPVNEIDHQVPKGESKTDYMGRFIMELKQLADDYNLLMICCAHPPKDGVEKRTVEEPAADAQRWRRHRPLGQQSRTSAGACGATSPVRRTCTSTSSKTTRRWASQPWPSFTWTRASIGFGWAD